MAKESNGVDLSESSIYNDTNSEPDTDLVSESAINRLEAIAGADEDDDVQVDEGDLAQQFDQLDASTEEETDALQLNLTQDDNLPDSRDGSGLITDDLAEQSIAKLTETGPAQSDLGAISAVPGRDDTSAVLRRHHPVQEDIGSDAIVEGNVEQPSDETNEDRKVDEGTAA